MAESSLTQATPAAPRTVAAGTVSVRAERPDGRGPDDRGLGRAVAVGLCATVGTGVAALLVTAFETALPRGPIAAAGAVAVSVVGLIAAHRFERLRRSVLRERAVFRESLENSPAGRLVTDAAGRTIHVNRRFERLASLRPPLQAADAGAVLAALRGLFAGEAAESFARLEAAARTGETASAELPVRRPGGGTDWRLVQVQPLEGVPDHLLWRVEDVTQRREAEEGSRREHVSLLDFMDHAPVGFYSVDQGGRFLFANATLAQWLGGTARDLTAGRLHLHDVLADPPRGGEPYALFGTARSAAT